MKEEFNHSNLSAARLQKLGIRSLAEVENSYFDPNRRTFVLLVDTYPIMMWIGFTEESKPIKVAYASISGRIVTLDVKIPDRTEIVNEYCKFCQ